MANKQKYLSVEEVLKVIKKQGGYVTQSELDFIYNMRKAREEGVGYGWMKQVIDWEWAHELQKPRK